MMSERNPVSSGSLGGDLSGASLFERAQPRVETLHFPLQGRIVGTSADPDHYRTIDISKEIAIPLPPHPGAFGVARKFHTHEGVDLYCDDGAPVCAIESGMVVAVEDFTGVAAGSPWWHDTKAVLVEGRSGVVCYGEIEPDAQLMVGDTIAAGQQIGAVKMVLRKDKGRPRSMLHLELHIPGTTRTTPWEHGTERPPTLLDPTTLLLAAARGTTAEQSEGGDFALFDRD